MTPHRVAGLAVATALVVGASYGAALLRAGEPSTTPQALAATLANPVSVAGAGADRAELDRLIAVFTARAPQRGESLEYCTLGGLLLTRAQADSRLDDYVAARDAYTSAIDLAAGDPEATVGLATALLGLHDFTTAARLAGDVADTDSAGAVATAAAAVAGDAALALGDHEAAATHYALLAEVAPGDPAVLVRRAQLAIASGDVAAATTGARAALAASRDLPADQRAFYRTFAAGLHLDLGDYDEAASHAAKALTQAPGSPRALLVAARVAAASGDVGAAIAHYEAATAIVPTPEALAALGDLYELEGRTAEAAAAYATVDAIARLAASQSQAYDRAYANFLLDHDREPLRALELAEVELAVRHDAAGYDTHAWALYRNGRFEEAGDAMDRALAAGMPSARISYHAGLIAHARGDDGAAVAHLRGALDLSPAFDPIHAPLAADLLEELTS
jgi:tetratricopeptide (TPR) repeat protein